MLKMSPSATRKLVAPALTSSTATVSMPALPKLSASSRSLTTLDWLSAKYGNTGNVIVTSSAGKTRRVVVIVVVEPVVVVVVVVLVVPVYVVLVPVVVDVTVVVVDAVVVVNVE